MANVAKWIGPTGATYELRDNGSGQMQTVIDGVVADPTATELEFLDGATSANATGDKVAVLNTAGDLITASNVGTAGTGVTAVEYGDGHNHVTVLTLAITLPNIPGGADLGVGNLIYTFPAGDIAIQDAAMSLAITQVDGNINADTPEVGLGTVIASGVVAVLSGTATFEDILTGQVAADCNGTATATAVAQALAIPAASAHTVHFNAADGWAASGDTGAGVTGTAVIKWTSLYA